MTSLRSLGPSTRLGQSLRTTAGLSHCRQAFRRSTTAVTPTMIREDDLKYARRHVRAHDPSGDLPGQLLRNSTMRTSYYAVRNLWVETGLRLSSTAGVPPHAAPSVHLEWWQAGIDALFADTTDLSTSPEWNHPTLRLLQSLLRTEQVPWEKASFDTILQGRRKDLDVTQYDTMGDLVDHAEESCANLHQLVLQSGHVDEARNPHAYEAAREVGIAHGLTNALRTSIPVVSTTGKLIVPAELTQKHGIRSPRYLLSALGQGDAKCVAALQSAVQEIVGTARTHLAQARGMRSLIQQEPNHRLALPVLLPALASDAFLDRLEAKQFQLTDRELRNVGWMEQAWCGARMIQASYQQTY